jgi:Glycosyltransferase family 87
LAGPAVAAPRDGEAGGSVSAGEAERVADRDPNAIKEKAENSGLTSSAHLVEGNWNVGYFAAGKEVALVIVDSHTGAVRESWTGYQVAWKMARGYSGAFGESLNAPYVFGPLCALFLLGLVDWRRWRRLANLDLLVLLSFGVSHFFFNRAEIGVAVPLYYPPLVYLLARALWLGFRGAGEGLRPVWPAAWLLVAAIFLIGFRVGLNVADSGTTDIGYAGVVGADRIAHGEPIYGNFPDDVSQGDTYGPVDYFAYVPFERIWPWSGKWDDLPASHAAAIVFDLATFALLILLALRIRPGPPGRRLAATLAFAWAAYPYTTQVLESNTNDALVAMLLVATLLALTRPVARGALSSLASFTKFAPAVLIPMLLTYRPPSGPASEPHLGRPVKNALPKTNVARVASRTGWGSRVRDPYPVRLVGTRGPTAFALGVLAVAVLVMAWPAVDPGLSTFWDRTIAFQASRDSPFSIWGQVPSLEPLRIALLAATGALSLLLAFRPRRKSLTQVAALGAALLIALQIAMHHWFYLYIAWFYPLLLIALAAPPRRRRLTRPAPSPARRSQPVPAG